jgi:ribonucleotide reductase alpha subunit
MSLKAVSLREIERVFEVLDRLGISREAVVIPLKPAHPGTVRVLESGKQAGKLEIVVDSETPIDAWLGELEVMIGALTQRG